jgi:pre-mRNA-splicing factor SPF27
MEGAAAMVAAEAANPSNVDIDAMPYVDQQMETIEQMKAYVDHLVAEEMKTFAPRDYLSHLPEPELKFLERPMLKAELERVQAGGEMAQMDTSRYAVAPPSGEQASDPAAWKAAISNAKAQLEHQVVRGENLELLRDYGPANYQGYSKYLDAVQQGMEAQRDDLKRKVDEINRGRKSEQLGAAERLHGLDQKWKTLVFGNRQIEEACIAMEGEIKRIKGDKPS